MGIDAFDVTVEVDVARGLPQWVIVGLPANAVEESRERVSAALVNAGFVVPPRRITVNLAPASWPIPYGEVGFSHRKHLGNAADIESEDARHLVVGAAVQPRANELTQLTA